MAIAVAPYPTAESAAAAGAEPHGIRLQNVSKTYEAKDGQHRTVLSNIDLTISAGEFVVVLGETGCGKSTLLRIILGEEPPSAGSVEVAGSPVRQIDSRCGYVPQKYSLFPNLTAIQNVMFGPRTARYHLLPWVFPSYYRFRKELRAEAMGQLLRMGLKAPDVEKYPHKMSGGMQQRVAIAQALVMHPAVLLMDEAFSALDPSTRVSLQELVLDIWREKRPTVMFVTHNVAEALFLGTRVIVLRPHTAEREGESNVVADLRLELSDLPFLERRHTPEFIELQNYVEQLSYGLNGNHRALAEIKR
jgi:NitT/TauT family transport system ATP-binding protein